MSTASNLSPSRTYNSIYKELLQLTLVACGVARQGAAAAADALGSHSPQAFATIADCERKLDILDSEIDERVGYAVTLVDAVDARDLLICMKFLLDLERIGDLLCAFAAEIQSLEDPVEMEDIKDVTVMGTILEKMLGDVQEGLATRDVEKAVAVVRADAGIDRRRNLLLVRLLETRSMATRNAVHLMFAAQALERAGDHAVNLGEEICHMVTGHSIRHVRQATDRSFEQRYVEWLKKKI